MKRSTAELVGRLEADAPTKVVDELSQRACGRDVEALEALVRYARDGKLVGVRDHVVAALADHASPSTDFLEVHFRSWLQPTSRDGHRYWALLGLINILGSAAYPELVAIASDESVRIDERAHAVKLLAAHAGQTFDVRRPSDPGHWRPEDLDISRLDSWASAGYPIGAGYVLPASDPALVAPATRLELAAAHLNRLLDKQRQQKFDAANPSNLLIKASSEQMELVKRYFMLPSFYLEFLERFSPLNVVVESRKFADGLQLFGADDLISGQIGYSSNSLTNEPIEDWPASMIVFGNDGGDPYTLDLSRASDSDAPVCSARHGSGSWKFGDVAPSFIVFLEHLK